MRNSWRNARGLCGLVRLRMNRSAQRPSRRGPRARAQGQGHESPCVSSSARSTGTPGRTWDPRSGCRTCSRRSCSGSSSGVEVQAERRRVFDRYRDNLAPHGDDLGIQVPVVPDGDVPGHHLFHVLPPDNDTRNEVLDGLGRNGIQATFHYVPLHSSDGGRRFGDGVQECPVSDDVSARLGATSVLRHPARRPGRPGLRAVPAHRPGPRRAPLGRPAGSVDRERTSSGPVPPVPES